MLKPECYEHIGRVLEAGLFEACFFEDLTGIYDTYCGSFDTILGCGGQLNLLDPLMVLPFIARATSRLGLGITLSTSFYHPFHIARLLAPLGHLSSGRVTWNVVTSAWDMEARDFGLDRIPDQDKRYDKAEESREACLALWDGWDADALILDSNALLGWLLWQRRVSIRLQLPQQLRPSRLQQGVTVPGRPVVDATAARQATVSVGQQGHQPVRRGKRTRPARAAGRERTARSCPARPCRGTRSAR
jgi:alkanesulfonate monooxygenase SsuD/methylene tetrahydromethanopterin reductase-like flavin-dependent oxidoreductase (luciferase family)